MFVRFILVLVVVGCLAGCVSSTSGKQFDTAAVHQLQPGVTTIDDAIALLGEPYQTVQSGETGNYMYMWQYVKASSGVLSSSMNLQHERAVIIFSSEGVMIKIHQLINIPPSGEGAK